MKDPFVWGMCICLHSEVLWFQLSFLLMHKVRLKHFLNMWIGAKSLLICEGLLIDKNVCIYT